MIGRSHRFHGYGSLNRVYREGRSLRGQLIGLRYSEHSTDKPYRVAVVVSRKVSKSAVKRGRIRRRLYEIVRLSSSVPANTDLVFTVFGDQVADMDIEKLRNIVEDLLKKANQSTR